MAKKKIGPYPYQEECLQKIEEVRQNGVKRALVVMASGLGKTYTSAFAVERFFADRTFGRVLVLCHSEEILTQTKKKFKKYFGEEYNYGMFTNSRKTRVRTNFLFATFQTMKGHRTEFAKDEFDYVVVDEAHHSYARTYFPTIKYFEPQFLLGLTATPDRLDGQKITEIYGEPIYELDFVEANCRDLLTKCDYRLMLDDMSQEKLDEYVQSNEKLTIGQLNRTIFVPKRDEEIVRLIRECMDGLEDPKTMIFCRTIKHARKIARLVGDEAALVYHGQGDVANEMALEAFRGGRLRMIISVQMLNEGIDVPDANHVVFLRSTVSPAVFYQQLGRGTRLSPGKTTVIVQDFVANCERVQEIIRLQNEIDDFRTRPPKDDDDYGAGGGDEQKNFTLNIATPEFKTKMVDIVELLERAANGRTWTKEEIITLIAKVVDELGRAPTIMEFCGRSDTPDTGTITRHFGHWQDAVKEAGFEPVRIYYTDDELIQILQCKADELGHTPSIAEVDADGTIPRSSVFVGHFGSWNAALRAASLEVIREHHYTRGELLEAMEKKIQSLGRAPSQNELRKDGDMPSVAAYVRVFGSWEAALKCFDEKKVGVDKYTDEEMIEMLQKKFKQLGHVPTAEELRLDDDMPGRDTYTRHFGSWKKALQIAKLPVTRVPVDQWTKEELIVILQRKAEELGHTPQRRELDADKTIPSHTTFKKIFGSWKNAIKAAGLQLTKRTPRSGRQWTDASVCN